MDDANKNRYLPQISEQDLTIVMYHYVRPLKESEFPGIKGLELSLFRRQLDYFQEKFNILGAEEVLASVVQKIKLPPRSCWLTFDDGYKDHHRYVLPELQARGLSASFFPPACAIRERKLLDVNAIQFILARCEDATVVRKLMDRYCGNLGISNANLEAMWNHFCDRKGAPSTRFDDNTALYVKRMLQTVLPSELRSEIISMLFEEILGIDKDAFSDELYLSREEIGEMLSAGMHFGSHGASHVWLDSLKKGEQVIDILRSLEFLEEMGIPSKEWFMCYPYGAFNNETLDIVSEFGGVVGLTTEPRVAHLDSDHPLTLPRFDTNDFPQ